MILNQNYSQDTFVRVLDEWQKEAYDIEQKLTALISDVKYEPEEGEHTLNQDLSAARMTAIANQVERLAEGLRALRSHARYVPGDQPPAPITGTVSVQQLGGDWRAKTHLHLVPDPVEEPPC
jgi:hypothetical protein